MLAKTTNYRLVLQEIFIHSTKIKKNEISTIINLFYYWSAFRNFTLLFNNLFFPYKINT